MIFEIYDKFDFSHSYLKSSILVPQLFKGDFSTHQKKKIKREQIFFFLIDNKSFIDEKNNVFTIIKTLPLKQI